MSHSWGRAAPAARHFSCFKDPMTRDWSRAPPATLGSVHQCRLELVLAEQRLRDLDRRRGGDRLAVGGEDADGVSTVRQVDRLHVRDLLGAEAQEGFIGEGREDSWIVVFHGYLLG